MSNILPAYTVRGVKETWYMKVASHTIQAKKEKADTNKESRRKMTERLYFSLKHKDNIRHIKCRIIWNKSHRESWILDWPIHSPFQISVYPIVLPYQHWISFSPPPEHVFYLSPTEKSFLSFLILLCFVSYIAKLFGKHLNPTTCDEQYKYQ